MSIYYVATDGSDGGAGTIGDPWLTIQYGYNQLVAGDTLYVRAGTYVEEVNCDTAGTPGSPITVSAYQNEVVTLDGEAGVASLNAGLPTGSDAWTDPVSGKTMKWEGLLDFIADYNVWDGIDVYRSMGRGIRVFNNANNIDIKNTDVSYSRDAGILLNQDCYYVTLDNVDVYRNCDYATYSRSASYADWGAAVAVKGNNLVIKNSTVRENWGEGINCFQTPDTVDIYDNVVYDNYALQIYVDHAIGVNIERNLVYHSPDTEFYRGSGPSYGIVVENESWEGGSHLSEDIYIANNLVLGCAYNLAMWCDAYAANNVAWVNNTSIEGAQGGVSLSGRSDQTNMRFKNNLIYQTTGTLIGIGNTAGLTVSHNCYYGGGSVDGDAVSANDVTADPLLSLTGATTRGNLVGAYFMITTGSPCIGAALEDSDSPANDYFGTSRSSDDIGGHEFTGSAENIEIPVSSLTLLSYAPTIAYPPDAPVAVTVPVAALDLQGYAPVAHVGSPGAVAELEEFALEIETAPFEWTDIGGDYLASRGLKISYGIQGNRPSDRLARPGKMIFYLDNSASNEAGLEGYYSPGHTNHWSVFVSGVKMRLRLKFGGINYYKGYGKVGRIRPREGTKGPRWVKVTVNDWLKNAQRHKVKLLDAQEDQRSDTFVATVIANMEEQPRATSYGVGQETFSYVGDDITEGKTAGYSLIRRATMSEFGYAMMIGDTVGGGTFLFQNRHARYKDRTIQVTIQDGDVFAIKAEYDPQLIFNIINVKINPRNVGNSAESLAELDSPIELVIGAQETIKLSYRDPDSPDVSMSGKDLWDVEGLNELDEAEIDDDMEAGISGWETGTPDDSDITQSSTYAKEGTYSLRVEATAGASRTPRCHTEIFGTFVQNDVIYVQTWLLCEESSWDPSNIGLYVLEYDSADALQTSGEVERNITFPTNGWVRLSGTYTMTDADCAAIRIQIKADAAGSFAGGEFFYIDNVYVIHDSNLNYEFSGNNEGGGDMNNDIEFIGSDLGGSGAEIVAKNTGDVHGFLTVMRVKGIAIRQYNPVTLPIEDETSKADHGDRPIALNLSYITSRVVGEVFGKDVLADYKDPVRWVRGFTFKANRSVALLNAALSIEPGKRVKFIEAMTAVDTEYFINGVRLRFYNKGFIDCTWFVTLAKTQAYWELETAGKSEMETTTRLAP